jgi:hypothetical protein
MWLSLALEWDLVITVFALLRGGRTERLVALLFIARNMLVLSMGSEPHTSQTFYLHGAELQAAFLSMIVWVAWRRRTPWLLVLAAIQVVGLSLAVGAALHLWVYSREWGALLLLGRASCLAAGVWRCWLGRPRPLPASGRPDIDLFGAALARWPAFRWSTAAMPLAARL